MLRILTFYLTSVALGNPFFAARERVESSERRPVGNWSGETNATNTGDFNSIPVRVADDATAMIKPMMASCQSVVRRSLWGRLCRYWSGAIV